MPVVLITGASRGLGLEFAKQYAADGWTVLAGLRDPSTADRLVALDGDITPIELDVADPASVGILGERLRELPLDHLVCNAGVYGPRQQRFGDLDYSVWQDVMLTNTFAPIRVAEAFLPALDAGEAKKIVAVTSKMGSIADNGSGSQYYYRSSKAALNAAMKSLAIDLAPQGIAAAVLHPGWVRTDMGGPSGLIDAEESVRGMRQVIDGLTTETAGRFYNYDGREIPW